MQTTMTPPNTANADKTPKAMTDLIDSAMSDGSYGSIPEFLIGAARTNPHLDFNSTIQHVLTWRKMKVSNRTYSTCLIGIPLFGQLGKAFAPISTVSELIKGAVRKSILAKEDGLVLLDSPVPRSTLQMLDIEELYNLSSRLFERGVRGNPEPVLSARLLEAEVLNVGEAIMVGLLYWRSDRAMPKILADAIAQKQLADSLRQHIFFDRASPSCPNPFIGALPMATFFDATHASSSQIVGRHVETLIGQSQSRPVGAEFKVVMSDEILGSYLIEVHLREENGSADHVLRIKLDSLRDGDIGESIQFLTQQLARRGITDIKTCYLTESFAELAAEIDEEAYATTTLH